MGTRLMEAKPHLSAMKQLWPSDQTQVSLCPTPCKETEKKLQSHSESKGGRDGAIWLSNGD